MSEPVTIGVVIPYFQREAGILRRALQSVAAQELPAHVRLTVVVVDDASPCPTAPEFDGLALPENIALVCLSRENGGPGAARNTGLDHLADSGADYAAFLDSDDEWYPRHLATATAAMEDGCDFYFANSMHDGVTSFSYFAYMRENHAVSIEAEPQRVTISGERAFREFVAHCIPHTSQVVFDFRKHPDIRFDTSLRRTGEDQLFWITLAGRSKSVTYWTGLMGTRGQGVSVYRDALAWDSAHAPDRLIDGLVFRQMLSRHFALDGETLRLSEAEAQATRDHLLFLCLRNLRRRPGVSVKAFARVCRQVPAFWRHLPETVRRLPAHRRSFRP